MKMKSLILLGLAAAVTFLLCGGYAFAQGEGGAAAPTEEKSIFSIYIVEGGPIGWLIILLSIAMVALIIEHIVTIQRDKLVPPEIIVELEQLVDEEQYEEAMNLCEASRNYITNIVSAALARVGEGFDPMYNAMENAVEEENLKLMQKISYLSLLGNVAPMLGLFGTVVGMVGAFTKIATTAGSPSPADLAGGIYTALVTTVWGLLVAIPALSAFFIFKNKVQKMTFELSSVAAELVERFKPMAQGK